MKHRLMVLAALLTTLAGTWLSPAVPAAQALQDAPGAVEDIEPLPANLWLDGTAETYRFTYWSTGSHNEPVLVQGTAFLPQGKTPAGGWPVLSWEHGTVGLAPRCAPSTAGYPDHVRDYLTSMLNQGYAIVATDYVIPGDPGVHPYLDGSTAARNAIDMVRAAREIFPDTVSRSWAAIGHSQGGHAALFTTSLATRYAPELDFRGGLALAPASGIVDQFVDEVGPGTPDIVPPGGIAYFAYVLRGLKAARPSFDLADYLTPVGADLIKQAETTCLRELTDYIQAQHITIGASLTKPMSEGDFATIAHPVIDIPLAGYDRPLMIAHGSDDTDLPIELSKKLVADLQANGVGVVFNEYPGADHRSVLDASLADTLTYLRGLFS
ncbi:prolyl oligopeptidase family serine peptidase [Solihabitans fulvus]|uniref:Prolyl oligopeptidase family serine peptidase n=1 Tax=Solihabitans fulvus TaxID=1892852 RepID=A0A5B2WN40_9PSEU|nr:lipase family protein [Solihabitans fulvus]KAA2252368.1 prolyl oligopeptidase family serine peptidase [Solihabitans fulvus]